MTRFPTVSIDIQVGRLRKKLNLEEGGPSIIQTERGVGYIFFADVEII